MIRWDLSFTLRDFVRSEKASGILLFVCTLISLSIANSPYGIAYLSLWQASAGLFSLQHWINDGLMAVFFLLIGLELERELHSGELSNIKNAILPIIAAIGGIIVPALIHFSFNAGTPTEPGFGIPMATDIAFALAALAILGSRIPESLKVFLVAFAVMDDLCAIVVIAVFYTAHISLAYLAAALVVWIFLWVLNRHLRVMLITPYLIGGALMWFFMLKSGVHATISGVMLAFAIPFSRKDNDEASPSHRLEDLLQKPVAFFVLPVFALANTAILFGPGWMDGLITRNSIGISAGLIVGKPLGVTLFSFVAVLTGVCGRPADLNWKHIFGAGILGGIGFTMSIFITNLAFFGDAALVDASKIAILAGSLTSGTIGFLWLMLFGRSQALSSTSPPIWK